MLSFNRFHKKINDHVFSISADWIDTINEMDYFPTVDDDLGLYNFAVRRSSFTTSAMLLICDDNVARPMKRLKISMSVSISHSAKNKKKINQWHDNS
jgi:hypothetical protein